MNMITSLALALLLTASAPADVPAAAPRAASVCLNVRDIQRTETPDDRTIIFHMRDGKVWSNRLKAICPMLKVSPYTQVLHSGDLVCSNQQFIHVTLTGDDCVLGEFTPAPALQPCIASSRTTGIAAVQFCSRDELNDLSGRIGLTQTAEH